MPSAFTAQQLQRLDARSKSAQLYLAIERPKTVWSAVVSGSHSVGATTVNYVSESVSEIPVSCQTLWVGTGPGLSDIAVLMIQAVPGAGALRVAYNHVQWQAGQFLTIVNQFRPWALFPYAEFDDERITAYYENQDYMYSNQNTVFEPLARIGPSAVCAFIESDGLARVKFYSNSRAGTGAISTHYWNFEGASPATSSLAGTSESPIEVTWSTPGEYLVFYVVGDTNSKTHVRFCKVYIFDRAGYKPITNFESSTLEGSIDNGWSFRFVIRNSIQDVTNTLLNAGAFSEGAQVVLFSEQQYDSHAVCIDDGEWKYRENILFVGWARSITSKRGYSDNSVEVEAVGPLQWMADAEGWPANLAYNQYYVKEDPLKPVRPDWHVISNMTPDKAAIHILREHTTLLSLVDFYPTEDTRSLLYADCSEARIRDQIHTQIYESIKAFLCANRLGMLYAQIDQQLVAVAERVGATMFDITPARLREAISLGEERDYLSATQVYLITFYYNNAGDPKRYGSLAPARELPTGQVENVTGWRSDSQDDTNTKAGLYLAKKNGEFAQVQAQMAGYYPVDVIPQQRVSITTAANDNARRLIWNAKSFWVRGVTIQVSPNGFIQSDIKLEAETDGPPGVYIEVRDGSDPVSVDGGDNPPEPDSFPGGGEGSGGHVVAADESTFYYSTNFLDDTPTWEDK